MAMAIAPEGPAVTKQRIPPRRIVFFLAMVAVILFLLWFIFEAIYNSKPRRAPSVYKNQTSSLWGNDAPDRHAPRIAVNAEEPGQRL